MSRRALVAVSVSAFVAGAVAHIGAKALKLTGCVLFDLGDVCAEMVRQEREALRMARR